MLTVCCLCRWTLTAWKRSSGMLEAVCEQMVVCQPACCRGASQRVVQWAVSSVLQGCTATGADQTSTYAVRPWCICPRSGASGAELSTAITCSPGCLLCSAQLPPANTTGALQHCMLVGNTRQAPAQASPGASGNKDRFTVCSPVEQGQETASGSLSEHTLQHETLSFTKASFSRAQPSSHH